MHTWYCRWYNYKHKIPSINNSIRRVGNPVTGKIFVSWTKSTWKKQKNMFVRSNITSILLLRSNITGNIINEDSSDKEEIAIAVESSKFVNFTDSSKEDYKSDK